MRDKLNSNPLAQVAVIGVLLIATGFFVLSSSGGGGGGGGGGEESKSGTAEATVSVSVEGTAEAPTEAATEESLSSALASVSESKTPMQPLPQAVTEAWRANQTLVLLVVRDGGIDDQLVKSAAAGLAGFGDVATFVVPAAQISRYAAITEGVGVERVPALVVVTPKHLKRTVPTASVSYGFQSPQSVAQAVIDAGYDGPTVDYHP